MTAAIAPFPALVRKVETTGVTITASGQVVWAHGLGAIPSLLEFELVCVTTDLSYAVGDRYTIAPGLLDSASSYGLGVRRAATNVTLRFGASTGAFKIISEATPGAGAVIDPTKWTLTARAFR